MNVLAALAAAGIASGGYPVCVVTEGSDPPDITCYDTQDVRGWRFCGEKEGIPPGGLFTDFDQPFRFVGLRDCGSTWCPEPVVTGYAVRKEVARNDAGVAFATGLIVDGMRDSFEPLDQFGQSACTFTVVLP